VERERKVVRFALLFLLIELEQNRFHLTNSD
jgi:hypothetical protein